MEIKDFEYEFDSLASSTSKYELCTKTIPDADSRLRDYIFGKIVNLNISEIGRDIKQDCKSLFLKHLSDHDPEIRAWIPLGILRWGFDDLAIHIVEASRSENNFTVYSCICRALNGFSIDHTIPESIQNQAVEYVLNPLYHGKEHVLQRERALKMLDGMGFLGCETFCKYFLDIDRWPYLDDGYRDKFSSKWNPEKREFEPGFISNDYETFSSEQKIAIEGYLMQMATVHRGQDHSKFHPDTYKEKYDQGDWWDSSIKEWNRTYFRHQNNDGIYENADTCIRLGLRILGEINTSTSRRFLVEYFNDTSNNKIHWNPTYIDGASFSGFAAYRFAAAWALGRNLPYHQIRGELHKLIDLSYNNNQIANAFGIRIDIARTLCKYGKDPEGLFVRLLSDDIPHARTQIREWYKEMGGVVDIDSILADILEEQGTNVENIFQYLEVEEKPDLELIHGCITGLTSKDDLVWFKDFLSRDGEFEGEEDIPFKKNNLDIVEEWIELIEGRILVTPEDPDLIIHLNPDKFREENT